MCALIPFTLCWSMSYNCNKYINVCDSKGMNTFAMRWVLAKHSFESCSPHSSQWSLSLFQCVYESGPAQTAICCLDQPNAALPLYLRLLYQRNSFNNASCSFWSSFDAEVTSDLELRSGTKMKLLLVSLNLADNSGNFRTNKWTGPAESGANCVLNVRVP